MQLEQSETYKLVREMDASSRQLYQQQQQQQQQHPQNHQHYHPNPWLATMQNCFSITICQQRAIRRHSFFHTLPLGTNEMSDSERLAVGLARKGHVTRHHVTIFWPASREDNRSQNPVCEKLLSYQPCTLYSSLIVGCYGRMRVAVDLMGDMDMDTVYALFCTNLRICDGLHLWLTTAGV